MEAIAKDADATKDTIKTKAKDHDRMMDLAKFSLDQEELKVKQREIDLKENEFQLDVMKHKLELAVKRKDYLSELVKVIEYLNGVQDSTIIQSTGGFEDRTTIIKGRPLNGHEEDLLNFSLITAKTLIAQEYSANRTVSMNDNPPTVNASPIQGTTSST